MLGIIQLCRRFSAYSQGLRLSQRFSIDKKEREGIKHSFLFSSP